MTTPDNAAGERMTRSFYLHKPELDDEGKVVKNRGERLDNQTATASAIQWQFEMGRLLLRPEGCSCKWCQEYSEYEIVIPRDEIEDPEAAGEQRCREQAVYSTNSFGGQNTDVCRAVLNADGSCPEAETHVSRREPQACGKCGGYLTGDVDRCPGHEPFQPPRPERREPHPRDECVFTWRDDKGVQRVCRARRDNHGDRGSSARKPVHPFTEPPQPTPCEHPDAIAVLEYVSKGRDYVDVEPYPDSTARKALGEIAASPQADEGRMELARKYARLRHQLQETFGYDDPNTPDTELVDAAKRASPQAEGVRALPELKFAYLGRRLWLNRKAIVAIGGYVKVEELRTLADVLTAAVEAALAEGETETAS